MYPYNVELNFYEILEGFTPSLPHVKTTAATGTTLRASNWIYVPLRGITRALYTAL